VLVDVRELSPEERALARRGRLGPLYVELLLSPGELLLLERRLANALADVAGSLMGRRLRRRARRGR